MRFSTCQLTARDSTTFSRVAALLDQIVDGVAMIDSDDILLNDRAIVEYLSNVVSRSANQFDPALKGLMVGLEPTKAGRNEW
jgi:hypothetical protein